jgi:hypothetical protein
VSFAVRTVEAVTVTANTEQPTAGSTITNTAPTSAGESKTFAITDASSQNSPVVLQVSNQAVADTKTILALATAKAELVIEADRANRSLDTSNSIEITVGKDEAGNFLQIGGLVIRGSSANGLTISLAGGNATETVPPETIPPTFQRIFRFGLAGGSRAALARLSLETPALNTATELSLGNDNYLGTEFNDGVVLSKGKDVIVGGGGDDIFASNGQLDKAKIKLTMDGSGDNGNSGSDQLVLAKGALKKGKAKITISDYNHREDVIGLETKQKKVKGIGSDTLKISTKNDKTIKIISDGTKFKRSGIEFI